MAGNYADVPGRRIPFDRDGTRVFEVRSSTDIVEVVAADLLQSQSDAIVNIAAWEVINGWHYFAFAEPMDITHYFWNQAHPETTIEVQWSTDTTNGWDGTWTSHTTAFVQDATTVVDAYRTGIRALATPLTGKQHVRVYSKGNQARPIRQIHLYGGPSAASPNRLDFWHPTLDERLPGAALDFGDLPQGGTAVREFRVKNRSGTMAATGINVTDQAITDASVSLPPQITYSADNGVTWTDTLTVPDLAAGAVSAVFRMRLVKPNNASLGVWSVRHLVVPTTMA